MSCALLAITVNCDLLGDHYDSFLRGICEVKPAFKKTNEVEGRLKFRHDRCDYARTRTVRRGGKQ